MPEPHAPSQPKKPRRFWLFAPYVLVLIALIAWTGLWWVEKVKLQRAVTDQAAALSAQGYTASFSRMTVTGWPFRMKLNLSDVRLGESSGWALASPLVLSEVLPYAPDHWIVAAPQGLTLTRPGKGALGVSGRAIRASVSGLGSAQPRFSFEGLDLVLGPGPGGLPAPFSSALRLELHLQPGPDDQAALLVRVEGAVLEPSAPLAAIQPGKPFDLTWDSRLSHLSALRGPNWPAALQAWAAAGGAMTVADGKIGLGGLTLQGQGGPLTVGPDGRLRGTLPLKLTSLFNRLSILSGPLAVRFGDAGAMLGPVNLGPSLKVG